MKPCESFKFAVFRTRLDPTTAADGKSAPDCLNAKPVSPGLLEFVNPFDTGPASDARNFTETGAIVCGNFAKFDASKPEDGNKTADGLNGKSVSPGLLEFVNLFDTGPASDARNFTETGAIVCGNFAKFDAAHAEEGNKTADGLNGELCDRLTVGDGVMLRDDVGDGVMLRDDVGDGVLLREDVGDGVLLRDDVGDGVLLRDDVGDGVLLRVGDGVLLREGDG
jgi:hypothetical protein